MSKKILIAKIISARGIKGEVKIMYFGDDVKNLEKYQIFDAKNQQFVIKLINKSAIGFNASGDKIIVAKIAGIEDEGSTGDVIAELQQYDPELESDLKKLLNLAKNNPSLFKMLLNSLRSM